MLYFYVMHWKNALVVTLEVVFLTVFLMPFAVEQMVCMRGAVQNPPHGG